MKIEVEKKFSKIGTSWGVILPAWIIKALGFNPTSDKIVISVENDAIVIRKK